MLDDMMSMRSYPRKVGHDLDLKISFAMVFHSVKCIYYHEFNAFGDSNK